MMIDTVALNGWAVTDYRGMTVILLGQAGQIKLATFDELATETFPDVFVGWHDGMYQMQQTTFSLYYPLYSTTVQGN